MMSEELVKKSCVAFSDVLASKAPVPGGGGVAALVGALGAALCSMVGNLTVGRKKYKAMEADVKEMLVKTEKVRRRLLELVDEDANSFEPLSKAYTIPKENPKRTELLDEASCDACKAPFAVMRCCCEAIELIEEMMYKGSATLISDVGCGAACCKAALISASMNIFVNTKALQDHSRIAGMEGEADAMLREYCPRADKIEKEVMRQIRREG